MAGPARNLESEFSFLKKSVLAVLVFGSAAKGEKSPRDTDICIVAPKAESKKIMAMVYQHVDVSAKKYDVYCFEELPLYLKWEVINDHQVVWSKDQGGLYEYFYFFRKLYEDQKHRMDLSKEEIMKMLHSAKN